MNRNSSFSSINSNFGAHSKQKEKKGVKSHRNANSLPVLPQINIQIARPTGEDMNKDIALGVRSSTAMQGESKNDKEIRDMLT